ncbi:hypothetical protein BpHYR1_006402, partial [Brachionus plicatilis]
MDVRRYRMQMKEKKALNDQFFKAKQNTSKVMQPSIQRDSVNSVWKTQSGDFRKLSDVDFPQLSGNNSAFNYHQNNINSTWCNRLQHIPEAVKKGDTEAMVFTEKDNLEKASFNNLETTISKLVLSIEESNRRMNDKMCSTFLLIAETISKALCLPPQLTTTLRSQIVELTNGDSNNYQSNLYSEENELERLKSENIKLNDKIIKQSLEQSQQQQLTRISENELMETLEHNSSKKSSEVTKNLMQINQNQIIQNNTESVHHSPIIQIETGSTGSTNVNIGSGMAKEYSNATTSIITYNCHGLKSNAFFVNNLLNQADVILLQETNISILTFDKIALIGVYLVKGPSTEACLHFNELVDKMLHYANDKRNNNYEVIILGDFNTDPSRMNSSDRETLLRIGQEGFMFADIVFTQKKTSTFRSPL